MKKLTPEFNAVTVSRREVFQIELKGLPSAGYLWSVAIEEGEGQVLSEQNKDKQNARFVGGEITQVFSLVGEKTGRLRVVASYGRPWEKTPARTETFTITVK